MNIGKEKTSSDKWLKGNTADRLIMTAQSKEYIRKLPNYKSSTDSIILYRGSIGGKEGEYQLQSWSWSKRKGSIADKYSHGVANWILSREFFISDIVAVPSIAFKGWKDADSYKGEYEVVVNTRKIKKSIEEISVQEFSQEEIDQQDDITKKWMVWSNEVLKEEAAWYKAIRSVHEEIQKEIADNLASLDVDEDGVLSRKVKASAILFDEKKIKDRVKKVAEKLIADTVKRFGEKAVKEANKKTEITKGGEGSGNFGHEGRPGLVGGSGEGGIAESGGTFYHGTHGKLYNKILEEGIKPQHNHTFEEDTDYYTGDRKGAVFVSKSLDEAVEWGKAAVGNFEDAEEISGKTDIIVFEIEVPKGVSLKYDEVTDYAGSRYLNRSIPSDWIKYVYSLNAKTGKLKHGEDLSKNSSFVPKYVVVIARKKVNAKK